MSEKRMPCDGAGKPTYKTTEPDAERCLYCTRPVKSTGKGLAYPHLAGFALR